VAGLREGGALNFGGGVQVAGAKEQKVVGLTGMAASEHHEPIGLYFFFGTIYMWSRPVRNYHAELSFFPIPGRLPPGVPRFKVPTTSAALTPAIPIVPSAAAYLHYPLM
jgi:hypothetical protein